MPDRQILLVVANSARMLAQFANKTGYKVIAIDCFSDQDTQELVECCVVIKSLALIHLIKALDTLNKQYTFKHIVYGSGFESYTDSLEFLYKNYLVSGNSPDVFLNTQNKKHFFSKLQQLKIPYPSISFSLPDKADGWLIKPFKSEGGVGIKRCLSLAGLSNSLSNDYYWQRYISGISMSVLFLANGNDFKIYGFHRQQVVSIDDNDLVFSSITTQLTIDDDVREQIEQWLAVLVPTFSLKGINSLDFIVDNQQIYLLEVNARPSASMQLYTEDLIAQHIESFVTGKLSIDHLTNSYQAYQILYAEQELMISKQFMWPSWVVDIPSAAGLINTGMPICSIIASGKSEQQVTDLLLSRKQQLIKRLNR